MKEEKKKDFASSINFFLSRNRENTYILFLAKWSPKGVARVVSSLIPVIRFPLNGFTTVCTRRSSRESNGKRKRLTWCAERKENFGAKV